MPVLRKLGFSLFFLCTIGFSEAALATPNAATTRHIQTLKTNLNWCGAKVRGLLQWINPREQGIHFPYEQGLKAKALRGGQELAKFLELFISPLPVSFVKLPTDGIFLKLWRSGDYEPTADEWAQLDRYKLRQIFVQKRSFMQRHPYWVRVQQAFVYGRRTLIAASLALALNHGIHAGVPIDRATYMNDARYQLGPTQIQLLNESVPFPHTAIRMGDKVYSYGYTHLNVRPVSQYLMNKEE
jgi:hypothetical protein